MDISQCEPGTQLRIYCVTARYQRPGSIPALRDHALVPMAISETPRMWAMRAVWSSPTQYSLPADKTTKELI